MENEDKKRVALFRYGVISEFINGRTMLRGEKERLLTEKCKQKWNIPCSSRSSIGKSVLKDWIKTYRDSGDMLESLYPKGRNDKGKIRSVDSDTILGLVNLRKEMPDKPLLILLKTARERSIIPIGVFISRATAYRIFQQHAEDLKKPAEDRRKFEAEKVNSLWQSDVMHGPQVVVNGEKQKSYLLAIIDDHSRLIVQAQFYLHERIIDEASLLRLEIFQELHTINHFENNPIPQLPIILAGQNSLIDILQYHNSRAFASRVVARSKLEPFSITETEKYLYHHLTIAGNNQRIFTEPAITAIHKISAGMLRKINNIARSLSDLGNRSEKNDKLRQIFWFFEANSTAIRRKKAENLTNLAFSQ